MTEIHIFRHGETEWNIAGRMQGFKDSPLTELGKSQAIEARSKIAHLDFAGAYSSTSSRASETAQILINGKNIPIYQADELKEINMGRWEGMKYHDVKEQFATQHDHFWNQPSRFQMEGAESFFDLRARATAYINKIAQQQQGKRVLVVSHAAWIKTLLTSLQSRPLDELWQGPYATNLAHSIVIDNGAGLIVKQFCNQECEYQTETAAG